MYSSNDRQFQQDNVPCQWIQVTPNWFEEHPGEFLCFVWPPCFPKMSPIEYYYNVDTFIYTQNPVPTNISKLWTAIEVAGILTICGISGMLSCGTSMSWRKDPTEYEVMIPWRLECQCHIFFLPFVSNKISICQNTSIMNIFQTKVSWSHFFLTFFAKIADLEWCWSYWFIHWEMKSSTHFLKSDQIT